MYNYISRKVVDRLPFEREFQSVDLVIDKSKNKREIRDFNQYLANQLQGAVAPMVRLNFDHVLSHVDNGIQAADMFCWGIFRKYEKDDEVWYNLFRDRIKFETKFLR